MDKLIEVLELFNNRLSRLEEKAFNTDYDDYILFSELREELGDLTNDS